MSKPDVNQTPWSLAPPIDPKALQTDANLRLATDNVQPLRLRRTLQELRQTLPGPHNVTAALLLATQQKYIEKIRASKGVQFEEEDEDEEADEDESDEDDSESDGASGVGVISELRSEEEEDEEDADDGPDNDIMERSELGLEEADDGTDEEGASITASLRQWNVNSGSQKRE